ncbi:hypothetical protein ACFLRT_04025 [Acidobacteriota bacterium]
MEASHFAEGTVEELNKKVHLFELRPATIYFERKGTEYYAKPVFSAPNPPFGAAINYYLKEKAGKDQPVHLFIYDLTGTKIRALTGTGEEGLNRVYWDLRGEPPFKKLPPMLKGDAARWFGTPKGPFVLPGSYKIVLEYGEQKLGKEIPVKKDKNLDYPLEEWKENIKTVLQLKDLMRKGFKMIGGIKMLDNQLQKLGKELKENKNTPEPVMKQFNQVCENFNQIKSVFFPKGAEKGVFRKPLKMALQGGALTEQVFKLYMGLSNYPGKPTATQKKRIQEILQQLTPMFKKTTQLIGSDIPELNRLLRENGVDFIKVPKLK